MKKLFLVLLMVIGIFVNVSAGPEYVKSFNLNLYGGLLRGLACSDTYLYYLITGSTSFGEIWEVDLDTGEANRITYVTEYISGSSIRGLGCNQYGDIFYAGISSDNTYDNAIVVVEDGGYSQVIFDSLGIVSLSGLSTRWGYDGYIGTWDGVWSFSIPEIGNVTHCFDYAGSTDPLDIACENPEYPEGNIWVANFSGAVIEVISLVNPSGQAVFHISTDMITQLPDEIVGMAWIVYEGKSCVLASSEAGNCVMISYDNSALEQNTWGAIKSGF